jgi:6-phosphofructokinase 1
MPIILEVIFMMKPAKCIGILTSGGDCPGLNAAIRAVAKSAMAHGIKVLGVQDGFRGLVENRFIALENNDVSGILTLGGTILGTSRDKPRKMRMGTNVMDMTEVAAANARKHHIDCLVCLGGNGTQKNAMHLHRECGLDVITLPKTIDNDVAETDISFGFDTAMEIATEAIDRLHTTATSHHRVIVCEVMGHRAGWLALGSGISGGADVILIPEIPYDPNLVLEHIRARRRHGKRFSIINVAEGARPIQKEPRGSGEDSAQKIGMEDSNRVKDGLMLVRETAANRVAREIEHASSIETRVTSLGHVQRGGSPSAADRLLCTRLGTVAGLLLARGMYNVMVAVHGQKCEPVPLEKVAGVTKLVPQDHPWIHTARLVDTCLGDRYEWKM